MEKTIAYIRQNFSATTVEYLSKIYRQVPNAIKGVLYKALFTSRSKQLQVSCICPTYGQTELLEEAIYSFLEQDFQGSKELVILNDFAKQSLVFDHPEVRIVNFPKRLRTLGEKCKTAVGLCSYDLIVVWHDDDIHLPHRLSHTVRCHYLSKPNLNLKTSKSFYSANKAWSWNGQKLQGPIPGRFPATSSWTRRLFAAVRGYAHTNIGYEEELESQFEKHLRALDIDDIAPQDIFHIQRQKENSTYQSPDSIDNAIENEYDSLANHVQKQADKGEIKLGRIELEPKWRSDYTKLVNDFLRTNKLHGVGG